MLKILAFIKFWKVIKKLILKQENKTPSWGLYSYRCPMQKYPLVVLQREVRHGLTMSVVQLMAVMQGILLHLLPSNLKAPLVTLIFLP